MTIIEETSDTLLVELAQDETIRLEYAFQSVKGTAKMIPVMASAGTPQTALTESGTYQTIELGGDDAITLGMLKPFFRVTGDSATVSFMRI